MLADKRFALIPPPPPIFYQHMSHFRYPLPPWDLTYYVNVPLGESLKRIFKIENILSESPEIGRK